MNHPAADGPAGGSFTRSWNIQESNGSSYSEEPRSSPRLGQGQPSHTSRPRVDVIIPTRDRPELLREALASVLTALDAASHLLDGRVLIVNNGAPLEIESADARVTWLNTSQTGASHARNLGVLFSDAEYIAFLDDDDIWVPDHLRIHYEVLHSRPELAAVFSQVSLCDADMTPVFPPTPEGPLPDGNSSAYILRHAIPLDALVARRSAIIQAGLFDEDLIGGEDWDLELRMAAKWPIAGIPTVSTLVRQSPFTAVPCTILSRRFRDTMRVFTSRAREQDRLTFLERQQVKLSLRGWYAYLFTISATSSLSRGDRRECLRSLARAFQASPVHAVARIPGFWLTLSRAVLPIRYPRGEHRTGLS